MTFSRYASDESPHKDAAELRPHSGVFLPLLRDPAQCCKDPLVLAYAAPLEVGVGHFSACLPTRAEEKDAVQYRHIPLGRKSTEAHMPVRFANDTDDQRDLLRQYLRVEEIPCKPATSTESSSAEPHPMVLVAKLTAVPHNQMAEDVGRRLLAQSCWAFQERKRKEKARAAARQQLPIVRKVPLLISLPPLTDNQLVSLVGKKIEIFVEKGSVRLRIGSEHALTSPLPNALQAASLTQPLVTLEEVTSAKTDGYLEKECTVEVFARHRESVRSRVQEQWALMAIPLPEDLAQNLAKDDWLAQRLAEAYMDEQRAAEKIVEDFVGRVQVTELVRSCRQQVLATLTDFGYLSAPSAPLQKVLDALANDDEMAAVLRRSGMNAPLAAQYLLELVQYLG